MCATAGGLLRVLDVNDSFCNEYHQLSLMEEAKLVDMDISMQSATFVDSFGCIHLW